MKRHPGLPTKGQGTSIRKSKHSRLFRQIKGGPIGLRLTGVVARLVMDHLAKLFITLERNKAETELKVIKNTISAKEELKSLKANGEVKENFEDIMMVDDEEWVEPRRRKRKNSLSSPAKNLNCSKCEQKFSTPDKFEEHERSHIDITKIKCSLCEGTFQTKKELTGHMTSHRAEQDRFNYSCDKCGKTLESKEHLEEHEKSHVSTTSENTRLECNKCEKFY